MQISSRSRRVPSNQDMKVFHAVSVKNACFTSLAFIGAIGRGL